MGSITSIFGAIWFTVVGVAETGAVTGKDILTTGKVIYQISEKTKDGTWGDSAHEEGAQIIKDIARGSNTQGNPNANPLPTVPKGNN
jgi:hypothetical protein|tara:strand:+ start:904 stop:1164 length:261 start_codon:yes stop_codon:yes gene_type:complete